MTGFTIIERLPTAREFNELRQLVGWPSVDENTINGAINSSIFSVCAVADNKTIGIGRILGDGLYFYIQDVIVHPHFQGQGIGKAMMKELMNHLARYAPKGSFIGLMAAKGKERFYEGFGFTERPNEIYGAGMCIYKVID